MVDLLILTSCINPPKQDFLMLTNQNERYKQMIDSINYYIDSNVFKNIVVCDGSNYNIYDDRIINYANKKNINIELLSFNQDYTSVSKFGKGYGEGEIMKYIICNSKLYKNANNFIKITGRLKVININTICAKIVLNNNYFNYFPSIKVGCVDTRFYMIQKSTYESVLINSYKNVNDRKHYSYEYSFTDDLHKNKIKFHCFPEMPEIAGYSGTTNTPYNKDSYYYLGKLLTELGVMNTIVGSTSTTALYILKKFKSMISKSATRK